ncbi:protein FAM227B [Rhea pennata]|uniref:protein FAM227B n=1 Tax=Rhea pennata TaxID=8795 RepID=UPI002E26E5C2
MQKPPFSFEEFLRSQNLKEWPRFLFLDEPYSLVDKLQKDYSFEAISKYLHENVPLNISPLSGLEKRVNACITKLEEHAQKIFSLQHGPGYLEEHLIPPEQPIAAEQIDAEGVLNPKSEMGEAKVAKYSVDKSKGRNVESYNYPGFKVKQLLELPRHLEAPKLWDFVIKAQRFKKDVRKVWRSLFLSKSSIAVFQDSFWWWFLQKFKPNQEDQDHLFDRIADSFVALFLLVPRDTKDAFFQVYPDCLSQVIYVAFCEAFPESVKRFDDDFKDELVDIIFQWISGLKPKKCIWRKWNFNSFKTTMINGTSKDATTNVLVSGSASSVAASSAFYHFVFSTLMDQVLDSFMI